MATERASDVAYRTIQEMILDLRLPPGSFVNENALATQLDLGRVPVREALSRLSNDRFVTILPRKGTVITALALDDVLDMFEAREAIECGVAYIAAERASAQDIDNLRDLIDTADKARATSHSENYLRDDYAVHKYLINMINNSLLQDAADRLLLHNLRFWRLYWQTRKPNLDSMLSHGALLSAIESGDPEAATRAMREHLHSSKRLIQVLF